METEDHRQIRELVARYNWALDTRDEEAFVATFVPEGRFVGERRTSTGPEELAGMVRTLAASPNAQGLQHWVNNLLVEEDGDGARLRAYMVGARRDEDGRTAVSTIGWYDDRVRKTADGWRFVERNFRSWPAAGDPPPSST